jgi:ATP synthase protein I
MPFVNPPSEEKPGSGTPPRRPGGLDSLVQAEKLMQIAFVLPCAMLVGWGMGWGVDTLFHVHGAVIVGVILGLVAGMVSVIRMATAAMHSLSKRGRK